MSQAGEENDPENQEEVSKCQLSNGGMKEKADEFRNLKQGTMRVSQYVHQFTQLSHYAHEEVSTDEKKQDRFRNGLNPILYTRLITQDYPDFNTLVEKTLLLEEALRREEIYREQELRAQIRRLQQENWESYCSTHSEAGIDPQRKFCFDASQQLSHQKTIENANQGSSAGQATRTHRIRNVRSEKERALRMANLRRICYNCRQPGHFIASCPLPNQGDAPIRTNSAQAPPIQEQEPLKDHLEHQDNPQDMERPGKVRKMVETLASESEKP